MSRVWRAFGLQPHREETFKLSNDPLFADRVRDVVGLYPDPPERAVVLYVDEKSQMSLSSCLCKPGSTVDHGVAGDERLVAPSGEGLG